MNVLLDTHVLLWWLSSPQSLSAEARDAIAVADAAVVSVASAWEISIKRARGRIDAPDDLGDQLRRHRFTVLSIHLSHALTCAGLPDHHRDPFDRMLVSQAMVENLTVVTRDPLIVQYDVEVIEA